MYKQMNGTDPVVPVSVALPKKTRYKKVRGQGQAVIVRRGRLSGEREKELMQNAAVRDREYEERRSKELQSRSGSRYADKAEAGTPQIQAKTGGSRYADKAAAPQTKAETGGSRYAQKAAVAVSQVQTGTGEAKRSITLPKPLQQLAEAAAGLNRKNAMMIAAGVVLAALVIGYAIVGVFYTSHFYDGTTIFGIDCSRYTVERARQEVSDKISTYSLTVDSRTGSDVIDAGMIGLRYRDLGSIERLLKTQKSFLWPVMMGMRKGASVTVATEYDLDKMDQVLADLSCYRRVNEIQPQDAYLGRDENGFVVVPEQPGSVLDKDAVRRMIMGALDTGATDISLEDNNCYLAPAITSDDPELNREVEARNALLGADLTYTFGDDIVRVNAPVIMDFIEPDGKGAYRISDGKVWDYISSLAQKYDTYGGARQFTTSTGSVVSLEGGDYGWLMDEAESAQQLYDAIYSKQTGTIEPVWTMTAKSGGLDDIGDTYVEVCISQQEMWCYQNGTLIVDTPVVTGNPNLNNGTPSGGVWAIDAKMTDFTLVGADYRVPVKYWMPFNENVGIHDLSSRYYYGGSIYLYGGSHGCVNTPLEAVEQIYNAVSEGTPVIVYE